MFRAARLLSLVAVTLAAQACSSGAGGGALSCADGGACPTGQVCNGQMCVTGSGGAGGAPPVEDGGSSGKGGTGGDAGGGATSGGGAGISGAAGSGAGGFAGGGVGGSAGGSSCQPNGVECTSWEQCCSKICSFVEGSCIDCGDYGQPCVENEDCCDGMLCQSSICQV